MRGTICIIVWLSASLASASWTTELQNKFQPILNIPVDPFVASVQSTCAETPTSFKSKTKYETLSFDHPYLKKKLKVKSSTQKGFFRRKAAPLVVFIGGSFGNANSPTSETIMEWLSKKGYHVLSFPNPWSKDFIKSGPLYSVGDYEAEAIVISDIIRDRVHDLQSSQLLKGPIRIVGVSHGAFVAAIIGTMNAESNDPLKIQDITALSPPRELKFSMEQIDRLILETESDFLSLGLPQLLGLRAEMCRGSTKFNPSVRLIKHAPTLTVWFGFQKHLSDLITTYDDVVGFYDDLVSIYNLSDKDELDGKEFKNSLNFENSISLLFPHSYSQLNTESANINYWFQRGYKSGFTNFRVLTADDDFINAPGSAQLFDASTLITNGGGHFGFRHLGWFKELIKEAF